MVIKFHKYISRISYYFCDIHVIKTLITCTCDFIDVYMCIKRIIKLTSQKMTHQFPATKAKTIVNKKKRKVFVKVTPFVNGRRLNARPRNSNPYVQKRKSYHCAIHLTQIKTPKVLILSSYFLDKVDIL